MRKQIRYLLIGCLLLQPLLGLGCASGRMPGPRGFIEMLLPGQAGTVVEGIVCKVATGLGATHNGSRVELGSMFTVVQMDAKVPADVINALRQLGIMDILCGNVKISSDTLKIIQKESTIPPQVIELLSGINRRKLNVHVPQGMPGELRHAAKLTLYQNVSVRGNMNGANLQAVAVNQE